MTKKIKLFVFSGLLVLLIAVVSVAKADIPTPGGAWLFLEPESGNFELEEVFQVEVLLDAKGEEVDGVDIHYLNYPQDLLEVQDVDPAAEGVQIEPGQLFPNTVKNEVLVDQGKIDFSQITFGGQKFSGAGTLATITFKIVEEGAADLTFDFTLGETKDCNVASAGQDALGHAQGGKFILGASVSIDGIEPLVEPPDEPPTEPPVVSNGEDTAVNGWDIASSKTVLYAAVPLLVILVVVLLLLRKRRKDTV